MIFCIHLPLKISGWQFTVCPQFSNKRSKESHGLSVYLAFSCWERWLPSSLHFRAETGNSRTFDTNYLIVSFLTCRLFDIAVSKVKALYLFIEWYRPWITELTTSFHPTLSLTSPLFRPHFKGREWSSRRRERGGSFTHYLIFKKLKTSVTKWLRKWLHQNFYVPWKKNKMQKGSNFNFLTQ